MPIIDLITFKLEKSSVLWNSNETNLAKLNHTVDIDYDVFKHVEKDKVFKLQQTIKITPDKGNGYLVECVIGGIFSFSENAEKGKQDNALLLNGNSILYGILRGHIAAITALCPGGQYTLPAMNFVELVNEIESKRAKKKRTAKKSVETAKVPAKRKK